MRLAAMMTQTMYTIRRERGIWLSLIHIYGFCQEKNMVQVPLTVLSEWERIECVDHEIFIDVYKRQLFSSQVMIL